VSSASCPRNRAEAQVALVIGDDPFSLSGAPSPGPADRRPPNPSVPAERDEK
jgi:hypothetical protein